MKIKPRILIHKYKNYFLDLFAPRNCAGCGKEKEILCENCIVLSFRFKASCVFCNFRNSTGTICKPCKEFYKSEFKKVLWAGEYKNALKNAIWELKYRKRRELAKPLGKLIYKKFVEFYPNYQKEKFLVIPIPLHAKKEHRRGFNQAEILAQEFSKLSDIKLLTDSLIKVMETKTQVKTKNKEERIKNLENAFGVRDPNRVWVKANSIWADKTIILIDDVSTTGATFLHASRTLQKALRTSSEQTNPLKIICLAVAHGYG